MAYIAVSGGKEAIEESIKLLDYYRSGTDIDIEIEAIMHKMSLLVDRVMSEAGLYSKTYAALALKQCEGSIEEAVFLLRAYRSTLTRNYYTNIVDTGNMRIVRRISAAFKDIPGGQILGATYDYTHRLINFDIDKEDAAGLRQSMNNKLAEQTPEEIAPCPRVSDELKKEGLIDGYVQNDRTPHDVTVNMLEFPADGSARLQTLSRADTGFISGLAYSSLRGFGQVHPTVGELRCGYVELCVPYLLNENESIYIGEILITEVESFNSADDTDQLKLAVGYGAVFGRNETKAIAMAVIDRELDNGGSRTAQNEGTTHSQTGRVYPVQDEEFVLLHGDSLEMNGFISHLKLPHYVTFQSKLDAVRKTRRSKEG
jgi:alpha-D-ribose 1-methylphosphonate 5-triphosphate synthase subunit PhnI